MGEVASAYVSLIPSAKGFGGKVSSQIGGGLDQAGRDGGKRLGGGMMASAKSFIGPMVGLMAAAAVTSFVTSSIKSLGRIEKINAQTETVIKSMGGASGVTAKHIEDLAGSLENLTATEAESIQEGANLLLTFGKVQNKAGKGNDIFDQTTKLMVDMGRAMGTDAKGSAIQLGKALNDPVKGITALTRVGVSFTEGQKETIKALVKTGDTMGAQKVILGELENQFGGSAAAYAKTTEGKIELAKHAIGTLGETVTAGILPVLGSLASVSATALNALATGFQNGTGAGGAFKGFIQGLWTAAQPLGVLIVGTVVPGVRALVAAFKAGGSDITSSGFAGVMERIGLAARVIADFVRDKAIPAIKDFATAVAIPALFTLGAYLKDTLIPAIGTFSKSLNDHRTAILGAAGAITMVFIPALLQLAVTATVSGAETIAIWAMLQASSIASTAASVVGMVAQGAKWVWLGHVAMINALKVAAATLIALGIWGLVAIAVIALGVLIWKNMDNIKGWISTAWNWIKEKTSAVWGWILAHLRIIIETLVVIIMGPMGLLLVLIARNWDKIKAVTMTVWNAIVGFISGVWNAILGFLTGTGARILNAITYPYRIALAVIIGIVLLLAKGVMAVVTWLTSAVVAGWNALWALVAPIVNGIKDFVVGAWTAISGFVVGLVTRLVTSLVADFNRAKNFITSIFNTVKGFLTGVWNTIFAVVSGVVGRIWGAVSGAFNKVSSSVGSVMGTVKGVISSAWDTIWGKISGITGRISGAVSGAFNGIKDSIGGAIGSAVTAASSLASKVLDAIKGGLGKVASIGGDIVQGLINGITGAGGKLSSAITNFIRENVPEPVRKVLGVNSPSKVFAELGRNTVEGFIVGVDDRSGALDAQMRSLVPVPRVGSLDFATPAQRTAAVGGVAGDGGNADLLAEVQGLRADIRALPKTYQMGQRQYVGAR